MFEQPTQTEHFSTRTKAIIGGMIAAAVLVVGTALIVSYRLRSQPSSTVAPVQFQSTPEIDLRIKGNRASHIYHLPGCPNYDDISERHIIWFKTKAEAEAKRFRMAKNCP